MWEVAEKITIVSFKAVGGAGGSFLPRELHGYMRYVRSWGEDPRLAAKTPQLSKHGESREEAVMLHGLEIDVMIAIIIIVVIIIIIRVNYTMNKGELCAKSQISLQRSLSCQHGTRVALIGLHAVR